MTVQAEPNVPLRAAVVGARIGRTHAAGYAASDRTELVGICDTVESRANTLADEHGVDARYTDFETMLREQRPEVLSIATPQSTHAPLTILAASQYRPMAILCEKAMASNLGEAQAMVATCDAFGVKLAIGHQGRWLPPYEQALDVVAEGEIGTPVFARVGCEKGGIMNHLTHSLDRMLFMLGEPEVEWVLGTVQRESDRWERGWPSEEMAVAVIGLHGGMRIALESETPVGPGLETNTYLIVGTEGLVIVAKDGRGPDYGLRVIAADGRSRDIAPPLPVRSPHLTQSNVQRVPIDAVVHAVKARPGSENQNTPNPSAGKIQSTPVLGNHYDECRNREIDALAAWATGEVDEHRGDAHIAIKTQEALMGIYESARTRTAVRMPLKTMASPLVEMIESGELPVRYPGRYDTRHPTLHPEG